MVGARADAIANLPDPRWLRPLIAVVACTALAACEGRQAADEIVAAPACLPAEARAVAERFGEQLQQVSLLAPDSVVRRSIREQYAPLVTGALLDSWLADPSSAPGREVSSPWPDRIEVAAVSPVENGCEVQGEVVYVTSMEPARGGAASRAPVTLRVANEDGWRVSAYEAEPPDTSSRSPSTQAEAPDVLRSYYAAIQARDFRVAYEHWADDGAATGQTFDEFAAGFAETSRVAVDVGTPGRTEGAAGSRYVDIPVVIRAELTDGTAQMFEGTYTLRKSVVDGATEDQQSWRIYSAEIDPVR